MGVPSYDIKKLLKEHKLDDVIPKMEENFINDKQFWGLAEETFEKLFEITKFGPRKKLMDRIKEIKDTLKKQFDANEKIIKNSKNKIDSAAVKLLLTKVESKV
jgi:hypothetical protein